MSDKYLPLTDADRELLTDRGRPRSEVRALIEDMPVNTKVDVTGYDEGQISHAIVNTRQADRQKLGKEGKPRKFAVVRQDEKLYVFRTE